MEAAEEKTRLRGKQIRSALFSSLYCIHLRADLNLICPGHTRRSSYGAVDEEAADPVLQADEARPMFAALCSAVCAVRCNCDRVLAWNKSMD